MGKALYRKYRSHNFDEIVGQDHITTALGNALSSGRIAHAYLLTGPRGVGKTSVARILAREVNSLPYSDEPHLDIIEIDAASNNSVEDVRELRDNILSAPTSTKYKVFIIDEVHMLSKAAFNALLKTLEEPPAHVIFILATTEAYKLPETIISRTQRYNFRPVPTDILVDHLRSIAQKEDIKIDDAALLRIAKHGDGSFRDSISLLDQASNMNDAITIQDVDQLLGIAPQELLDRLVSAIAQRDMAVGVRTAQDILEQGYEPAMVAAQLGERVRDSLLQPSEASLRSTSDSIALLRGLLDVPAAPNPKVLLELVIVQACSPASGAPSEQAASEVVQAPAPKASPVRPVPPAAPVPTPPRASASKPDEISVVTVPTLGAGIDDTWESVLEQLKKTHNTLYGVARMAKPQFDGDTLTLAFSFAFHQKRFNEPKNRAVITVILEELLGKPIAVDCIVLKPGTASTPKSADVSTISNIFGGAELLES